MNLGSIVAVKPLNLMLVFATAILIICFQVTQQGGYYPLTDVSSSGRYYPLADVSPSENIYHPVSRMLTTRQIFTHPCASGSRLRLM